VTTLAVAIAVTFVIVWVIVAFVRFVFGFIVGLYYGATLPDSELLLWLYKPILPHFVYAALTTAAIWALVWWTA
jgi:hypothetical protein